ncbi:hypothetical protein D0817_20115 [Flavobacterium cupreum]|uniref:Uncharacterized protein n=1 Tax=Flavobacterium cupreum TaxID=2133766 RepID=A0A434A2P2_9FLAO|nr:hypothetical protein [Flavobacterium cupreum]RUT68668.1 hypothetical protein D0817_20115 [Flavobacterium cupreum]
MEKLISNTAYGIEVAEMVVNEKLSIEEAYLKCCKYDQFLSQKVTLGIFVPAKLVNGEWVVLTEPKGIKCCAGISNDCDCRGDLQYDSEEIYEYQEAKESVLFEGFAFNRDSEDYYFLVRDECYMTLIRKNHNDDIESLIGRDYNLTATAQKQIGL